MSGELAQTPFADSTKFVGKKIHFGVSGSIACYKAADLLRVFRKLRMDTTMTLTGGAREFVTPILFKALGAAKVYGEMFDPGGDVFAHLEPGQEADVMLVAPASANVLAKLAHGDAGDMLSAQALAFPGPLIVAPAMNPRMWAHAATQANVRILEERGCHVVKPGTGATACGEEGQGRLAELPEIFLEILRTLSPQDMAGLKVMITLGPTREPWDGVRFFSNSSSGIMGAALATAAWLRGAEVTAICGPGVSVFMPDGIERIHVNTAAQMLDAATESWKNADWGMFCAAVADFAPQRPAAGDNIKIKKQDMSQDLCIPMHANPDILATLARERREGRKILGFAAQIVSEMKDLAPLAREKLQAKGADVVAANRVNGGGTFGARAASMVVVDKNGTEEIWNEAAKADIAWELCTWLLRI